MFASIDSTKSFSSFVSTNPKIELVSLNDSNISTLRLRTCSTLGSVIAFFQYLSENLIQSASIASNKISPIELSYLSRHILNPNDFKNLILLINSTYLFGSNPVKFTARIILL